MKRRSAAILLALALTAAALPATAYAAESVFLDVPDNYWACDVIMRAYENRWIKGLGGHKYAPTKSLTYAEFTTMAANVCFPEELAAVTVPAGAPWYYACWTAAQPHGLHKGTAVSGMSDLPKGITRYDMAQMIANIVAENGVAVPEGGTSSYDRFKDRDAIPASYRDAIQKACALGLLKGKSGRFAGSDLMTRAEAATVLCRLSDCLAASSSEGGNPPEPAGKPDAAETKPVDPPKPASPAKQPAENLTPAEEVVRLVNAERAKEGLPALGTMENLTNAAQLRAGEIITVFEHTRPDGSSCTTALGESGVDNYRAAGENIAAGLAAADATVELWMNSPGHRANILSPEYTHIGVGYAAGGEYGHYWVQMFIGR